MKYYSEEALKHWLSSSEWLTIIEEQYPEEVINVRRCRDCEHFSRDFHDLDSNFGYCEYYTDYSDYMLNDEPIRWFYTNINGFCNEDNICQF